VRSVTEGAAAQMLARVRVPHALHPPPTGLSKRGAGPAGQRVLTGCAHAPAVKTLVLHLSLAHRDSLPAGQLPPGHALTVQHTLHLLLGAAQRSGPQKTCCPPLTQLFWSPVPPRCCLLICPLRDLYAKLLARERFAMKASLAPRDARTGQQKDSARVRRGPAGLLPALALLQPRVPLHAREVRHGARPAARALWGVAHSRAAVRARVAARARRSHQLGSTRGRLCTCSHDSALQRSSGGTGGALTLCGRACADASSAAPRKADAPADSRLPAPRPCHRGAPPAAAPAAPPWPMCRRMYLRGGPRCAASAAPAKNMGFWARAPEGRGSRVQRPHSLRRWLCWQRVRARDVAAGGRQALRRAGLGDAQAAGLAAWAQQLHAAVERMANVKEYRCARAPGPCPASAGALQGPALSGRSLLSSRQPLAAL